MTEWTPVEDTPAPERRERCAQCWKFKPWPEAFIGRRGLPIQRCTDCQAIYSGWGSKTLEEKVAARAARERPIPGAGGAFVRWTRESKNVKTGPIPVTMTDRDSCPTSCSLRERGCYAEESRNSRIHWSRISKYGMSWADFLAHVRALPPGQLWRHNEAGDLPGIGDAIDKTKLLSLVEANRGRRGFTFTHKPLKGNRQLIKTAVRNGFTINLSADSIAQADTLFKTGLPVTVVVPASWPSRATRSPGGNIVVVCPAQRRDDMTCATCKLCAIPDRGLIVAFRAHGLRKALVSEIVKSKRAIPVEPCRTSTGGSP